MKPKVIRIIAGETESTPLEYLKRHEGYCENVTEILDQFRDLREHGLRFQGAWKVTIEKVDPKIVKVWRRVALRKSK